MDKLDSLRESNGFIGGLVRWQKTMWFPIVYAALGVLACTFGMAAYLPVFYIYVIFAVFAALFNDDVKVFAVPLLMTLSLIHI